MKPIDKLAIDICVEVAKNKFEPSKACPKIKKLIAEFVREVLRGVEVDDPRDSRLSTLRKMIDV